MKLPIACLLLLTACRTTAPATRPDAPAPPVNDGYALNFPAPPGYEQARYQDVPLHRFSAVSGNVTYSVSHATIPGMSAQFVGGAIKDHAGTHGFKLVSFEDITLANAEAAQSFVGAREGLTISGIGCKAGERLYMVMTEHDPADAAQVAASAEFIKSFRP